MSARRLVIINAGLSNPSTTRDIATRVADAAVREQKQAQDVAVEVTVLDLRSLAGDLATFMTTMIPTPALEDARLSVSGADALIAATPVFQGSYAGLFKMFFDTLDKGALEGTPTTLVATAGTPRHSMVLDYAMRPLLAFLHAKVLPTGVFVDTGEFGDVGDLQVRLDRAGSELAAELAGTPGAGVGVAEDAPVEQTEDAGFEALLRVHSGV